MPSSGMLRREALVRSDVYEECIFSIFRVPRIDDLIFLSSKLQLMVTANVVSISPTLVTLITEELRSSETSVRTRVKRHNIQEDGILLCF
jgi:hypothetical protein